MTEPIDLRSAMEREKLRALRAARDATLNHGPIQENCPRCLYTRAAEAVLPAALDLIEELLAKGKTDG